MNLASNPVLYCLVSILYLALAAHAGWRQHVSREMADGRSMAAVWLERIGLLVALLLHGILLVQTMFADQLLHFGFAYALSTMLWLGVLFYWLESFAVRLTALPLLLLPLAAAAALLPWMFPGGTGFVATDAWGFRLHLLAAILAYSLLTMAALHAVLMTAQERRLHAAPSARASAWSRVLESLPPLLTMEKMLFRMLTLGFVLLTLTLLSGVLFAEVLWHRAFHLDHKTVFAVLSWLIFGALLLGRYRYGWRGRRALRWTLAGFAALMLAYVGSRFVLEVILHRF
ncbi:MAG: inner membrane protein YpjD [Burkholderiaceae bacterium]|nr:MAG: inner membrane protein YpjD [Burkholderiaceae bacterium]